ncbi:FeoB-associated Cys-rich membrane protein [Desulfobulbus oligotrophicus]|uniref:FeoB-associated Cys-rich membrane protein n=1 Tax=Desulfobulbus oligotrophicus TaxID=1909699 RepID=A0A7T5VAP6_9BACT|nr:FeoB-associated Cys-rich membrane protein [Desulfobulbus oligotrophicus]QQG64384.1 FeoB-associated Cys-rich membrane protein [Desulfobulbus oligotrophicus]
MQKLLVASVVIVAGIFLARRIWRFVRRPDTVSCGCGCSGCAESISCPTQEKVTPPVQKP